MFSLVLCAALMGPPAPQATLTVPVEEISDRVATHLTWIAVGAAADLYSTAWTLSRCPACRESNPLGFNSEARVSLKMATAAAMGLTVYKLERGGHHTGAKIVRWVYVGSAVAFVANNVSHGLRRR